MSKDFASLKNARNLMLKDLISWWIAILKFKVAYLCLLGEKLHLW
ncbi:hypothetical protein [Campylobacter concisus]|nr:hypothetical protein [Campylobacter concisus]